MESRLKTIYLRVSGQENRDYGRAVGIRQADHVALSSPKVGTNFADRRQLIGRHSSLADSGHRVCLLFISTCRVVLVSQIKGKNYFSVQGIWGNKCSKNIWAKRGGTQLQCTETWHLHVYIITYRQHRNTFQMKVVCRDTTLECGLVINSIKTKKKNWTPWSESASELTAACRRSDCQLLRIEGATWSVWRIPTAVLSIC
jgi:hypothetical protein